MSARAAASTDPSTSEIVFGSELADLEAIFEPEVQLATAPIPMAEEISTHLSEGRLGWEWKQFVAVDANHQPDVARLRSLQVSSAAGGDALRAAAAEVLGGDGLALWRRGAWGKSRQCDQPSMPSLSRRSGGRPGGADPGWARLRISPRARGRSHQARTWCWRAFPMRNRG